jgi:hypothetical protein
MPIHHIRWWVPTRTSRPSSPSKREQQRDIMMSHCVVLCLRGEAGLRLLIRVGAHRIAILQQYMHTNVNPSYPGGGGGA